MKRCIKCNGFQANGNFCSGCGGSLRDVKFNMPEGVKFKRIETSRQQHTIQNQIRSWLKRLGVKEGNIKFVSDGVATTVEYELDKKNYVFTSFMQKNERNNWAAVEQFLHYRIIGIERGIESKEKAFEAYTQIAYQPGSLQIEDRTDALKFFSLKKGFTLQELETRYRELAKKYHPDVTGNNVIFQQLGESYETLKKEARK